MAPAAVIMSPSAEEGVDLKASLIFSYSTNALSPSAEEGVDLKTGGNSRISERNVSFRGGRSGFKEQPRIFARDKRPSPSAEEGVDLKFRQRSPQEQVTTSPSAEEGVDLKIEVMANLGVATKSPSAEEGVDLKSEALEIGTQAWGLLPRRKEWI